MTDEFKVYIDRAKIVSDLSKSYNKPQIMASQITPPSDLAAMRKAAAEQMEQLTNYRIYKDRGKNYFEYEGDFRVAPYKTDPLVTISESEYSRLKEDASYRFKLGEEIRRLNEEIGCLQIEFNKVRKQAARETEFHECRVNHLVDGVTALQSSIITSTQDFSETAQAAWLYGILIGWDDDALTDLRLKFNWTEQNIRDLESQHEAMNSFSHPKSETSVVSV